MPNTDDVQIAMRVGRDVYTNYTFETTAGRCHLVQAFLSSDAAKKGYLPSLAEIQAIVERNIPRINDPAYQIDIRALFGRAPVRA